jgi:hypothetical protein
MGDIADKVDKAYEGKSVYDLAKAPVEALQGISPAKAAALKEALGVVTIKDLGTNKYVRWAQSISTLAE